MNILQRLHVAGKAHQLTLDVYSATSLFPTDERFLLGAQVRRAAVSIGSNIVEGEAHGSSRVFVRHLHIALGSAGEVEYQLLLARDLGYLSDEEHMRLADAVIEVRRMLAGLISSVGSKPAIRSQTPST